ncbi:MAG: asparagine synthase (glutamine-hydrolyzing) [Thermoguttaceae bacterium]
MCGIAGVLHPDRSVAAKSVHAMNAIQQHRGPDDEGVQLIHTAAGVLALGHRRLSILDLSSAGHQPMTNPETGDWIVYNGEVYNYPALRTELQTGGAQFRSHCDTEAILHAYARWGVGCFERLEGMFAVAIYDARQQQVVLARDPLGIKPLYYGGRRGTFVFASELRALEASSLLDRQLDERSLACLLAYGAVQSPLTMFRNARSLPGGTFVVIDLAEAKSPVLGEISPRRYWRFPDTRNITDREEAVHCTSQLLVEAVSSHLLSDVPVGIFLSSGLDSTAIALLAAQSAKGSVDTFTMAFDKRSELDESSFAEATATAIGAHHTTLRLDGTEVCRRVAGWLQGLDQPGYDGLNTFLVAGAAAERGLKVALSGLGADEMFGGYPTLVQTANVARRLRWAGALPERARRMTAGLMFALAAPTRRRKVQDTLGSDLSVLALTLQRRRLFSEHDIAAFGLSSQTLDRNYQVVEALDGLGDLDDRDPESVIGTIEARFYMGNILLRDSDVYGMAHGLEIRVPFLDRRLTDYVYGLPGHWRIRNRQGNKPLMVDALNHPLLRRLQSRPKTGFALPYSDWMLGPLRDLSEAMLKIVSDSGLLAASQVERTWHRFLTSRGTSAWSRAWMLIVLGAWLEARKDIN